MTPRREVYAKTTFCIRCWWSHLLRQQPLCLKQRTVDPCGEAGCPTPTRKYGTKSAPSLTQVARIAPEDFWKFSLALFKNQGDYFDIPTSTMTPLEIRAKLATLAAEAIGADKTAQFSDLLALKSSANGGTAVTDDLKYTSASFPAGAITSELLAGIEGVG